MSLRAEDEYPIPEVTRRVAHAAFPKGTLCMRLADRLGPLYRDEQFAALFPVRGQPALSPARLALVTVLQFVERLSDRQAADAVRGRIDWKYALGLELTDPGFDHTVLSWMRFWRWCIVTKSIQDMVNPEVTQCSSEQYRGLTTGQEFFTVQRFIGHLYQF